MKSAERYSSVGRHSFLTGISLFTETIEKQLYQIPPNTSHPLRCRYVLHWRWGKMGFRINDLSPPPLWIYRMYFYCTLYRPLFPESRNESNIPITFL